MSYLYPILVSNSVQGHLVNRPLPRSLLLKDFPSTQNIKYQRQYPKFKKNYDDVLPLSLDEDNDKRSSVQLNRRNTIMVRLGEVIIVRA
jgi:hypothetical protein